MRYNKRTRRIVSLEKKWQPILLRYLEGLLNTSSFSDSIKKKDYDHFGEFIENHIVDLRGDDRSKLIALLRSMDFGSLKTIQLHSKSKWKRAYAAHFLGLLGHSTSIPDLEVLLSDPSQVVAYSAAISIIRLGGYNRISSIINIFNNREDYITSRMKEILLIYGKADPNGYIKLINHPHLSSQLAIDIIEVLTELRLFEGGKQVLDLAQKTEDREIIIACIKALGELSILESKDFLMKCLKDDNWIIRSQAAKSLTQIGDEKIIPPLSMGLEDNNYWVRYYSASSIAKLGESGVDFLKEYCSTSLSDRSKNIVNQVLFELM